MKRNLISAIVIAMSANSYAAQPIFSVTPNMKAPTTIYNIETGTTVYQITNNTPHTLNNIGIAQMPGGVTPNLNVASSLSDYCPTSPFSLTAGSSCLLKVQLNAGQLGSGLNKGPIVCYTQTQPVYCSQPYSMDQINMSISRSPMPQDCTSNTGNFNYMLFQSLDSPSNALFLPTWGPARNTLSLSPSNPNLTNCPVSGGLTWEQNRVLAAASYWVAQKLNYCHHYNPDYMTPVSLRGASGSSGGYCNPATDIYPGTVYYGQQARWNYNGQGSETANNWVNNNQMWYGMDCSNYTAFLYNFSFGTNTRLGIPFDSKTGFQGGQQSTGCSGNTCPQDGLAPSTQIPNNPAQVLNNPNEAGLLVCADGTTDPTPSTPTMCVGHGGYLTAIDSAGHLEPKGTVTPAQIAQAAKPGDLLFIAGGGVTPGSSNNPDGSSSIVTHVVMWLGKQVGYGPNDINPSLIAPDDECPDQSIWGPTIGAWVITDSHYQGADYRVLTSCFYLNNLWGVRRVLIS